MQPKPERIALVTGANKGIGLETARQLRGMGIYVLVGARDATRGSQAAKALGRDGIACESVLIDLARSETIHEAAAALESRFGRLDILVNNAGISDRGDGPLDIANIDAVRRTFETNFFGTLLVTQAMLPLLRKSSAGRIVNVSSGLGSLGHNGDPTWEFAQFKLIGYSGSKAALNMITVQLAASLSASCIKVNSADPGFTATDLNQHRGRQPATAGALASVRLALLPDDGPTGRFFSTASEIPW